MPARRTYESLMAESLRRPRGTAKPGGAGATRPECLSDRTDSDDDPADDDDEDDRAERESDPADDEDESTWSDDELSAYDGDPDWDRQEPAIARVNGGDGAE